MQNQEIEKVLRKIDTKFVQDLSDEQRHKAFKSFRMHYAQQMGKVAVQLLRIKKVQQNIQLIEINDKNQIKQIDQESKERMQHHLSNRQKYLQNKSKQHKILQEHWKKRWEDIHHKKVKEQNNSIQKAKQSWRQANKYWTQKSSIGFEQNKSKKINCKKTVDLSKNSQDRKFNMNDYFSRQHENNRLIGITVDRFNSIPSRRNRSPFSFHRGSRDSSPQSDEDEHSKDKSISLHQIKHEKITQSKDQEHFQKFMQKLASIEHKRQIVLQKIQNNIKQNKKNRQIRQNPETVLKNIQQSREFYKRGARKCKQINTDSTLSKTNAFNPNLLSKDHLKHLNFKKKIDEEQFEERERSFDNKVLKLRRGKLERMVKQAVNALKHEAMSQAI